MFAKLSIVSEQRSAENVRQNSERVSLAAERHDSSVWRKLENAAWWSIGDIQQALRRMRRGREPSHADAWAQRCPTAEETRLRARRRTNRSAIAPAGQAVCEVQACSGKLQGMNCRARSRRCRPAGSETLARPAVGIQKRANSAGGQRNDDLSGCAAAPTPRASTRSSAQGPLVDLSIYQQASGKTNRLGVIR